MRRGVLLGIVALSLWVGHLWAGGNAARLWPQIEAPPWRSTVDMNWRVLRERIFFHSKRTTHSSPSSSASPPLPTSPLLMIEAPPWRSTAGSNWRVLRERISFHNKRTTPSSPSSSASPPVSTSTLLVPSQSSPSMAKEDGESKRRVPSCPDPLHNR